MALIAFTHLLHGQSATVVEAPTATLHVSTQVVLLDVDVVDKRGHRVAAAVGRDDFEVAEDGKPQRLLSFEPPAPQSTVSTSVFVLDELNASPADKAYYLICLEQYLRSLPETLPAPAELMVLTASSLRIMQAPTRSRADLLKALTQVPPNDGTLLNLVPELFARTVGALELVAVGNLGAAGRTAVVWLGPGYGIDLNSQAITKLSQTERYIRYLANTLLESRTTLYVIFPPDFIAESASLGRSTAARELSGADPFNGGINFRTLAAQTGGAAYIATNDLASAMRSALDLGHGSYTLGYRPDSAIMDGRFRHIQVKLRDPNLHVITKSGYYAPEQQEQGVAQTLQIFQMSEAARSTLPFHGIPLRITHIDRSADGTSAEFTVLAEGKDLSWRAEGQSGSLSELTVGGLGLSKEGKKLSSHFRNVNMEALSQNPVVLQQMTASFKLNLAVPSNTDRVRLVVSSRKDGKLGCIDIDRATLDAAPSTENVPAPGP